VDTPVDVVITRNDLTSNSLPITLTEAAPSVFGISGTAIMTCDSAANCTLWGNGFGAVTEPQADGVPAALHAIQTLAACKLQTGGQDATVTYCGAAPGLVIDQLNFVYPANAAVRPYGTVSATLTVGDQTRTLSLPHL